jgi:DNA-binding NtrC family response regulator
MDATQLGALDYVVKGENREDLLHKIRQAVQYRNYLARALVNPTSYDPKDTVKEGILIGAGPLMLEVFKAIGKISQSNDAVLITGETGTGKELVARELHRRGNRPEGPFVAVNGALLVAERWESELFGHERGAYTGAVDRKVGLVEVANGGTLFIDEVGEISVDVQPKLLRFLEDGGFRRMGDTTDLQSNCRVVVATNRPLELDVREKRFRGDLYYRLNVNAVRLPPLRERREDIPRLVRHFLRIIADQNGGPTPVALEETVVRLAAHDWPGNVRELKNVLGRAFSQAWRGLLLPQDVDRALGASPEGSDPAQAEHFQTLEQVLGEVTRRHVQLALVRTAWNQQQAAKLLDIDRETLRTKIRELGLKKPD